MDGVTRVTLSLGPSLSPGFGFSLGSSNSIGFSCNSYNFGSSNIFGTISCRWVNRCWFSHFGSSNSFGFGGQNACLVLRRWEDQ